MFLDGRLDFRNDWAAIALPRTGDLEIRGTKFDAITVEHGNCTHASILHVLEPDLVCAGDVEIATHLYLAEANPRETTTVVEHVRHP